MPNENQIRQEMQGKKKKEKRNKEQVQPKQSIMNMRDINETLQIILNVNGLNVPIKRHS